MHAQIRYQDIELDNTRRVRKYAAAMLDRMRWLADGIRQHRYPDDWRAQEYRALRWALSAAIGESEAARLLERFQIGLSDAFNEDHEDAA